MLDDRANAVAVGGDQESLTVEQRRDDLFLPARHHPLEGELQRLRGGQIGRGDVPISAVPSRMLGMVFLQCRRRDVVRAPPDVHLLVPVFGRRLRLVQTLQRAVVALVQTPVSSYVEPRRIDLVKDDPERMDCPLQ